MRIGYAKYKCRNCGASFISKKDKICEETSKEKLFEIVNKGATSGTFISPYEPHECEDANIGVGDIIAIVF